MWQYCRIFTSNYYYTCGSTAAVSNLIITKHVVVLPQYHISIITIYVAVLPQFLL